jgi:glycosyltransferase involved in cell wall biosynthesis
VHTSLFNANLHGRVAAVLAGVPVIFSEEHSEHYQYDSLRFLPYVITDRILSRFTSKIICCSEKLLHSLSKKEGISSEKLASLVNAIDPERMENLKDRSLARKELGLSDSDIFVGNIASLSPRKGQEYLIEAFAKVGAAHPTAKLFIIGKEFMPVKNKLLKLAERLKVANKIVFLGERRDALDLLNAMDVLAISSLCEGLPLVVLEAMYLGIPVVSTDVGGISEAIVNDFNGLLVPKGDAASLGSAISMVLSDFEKRSNFCERSKLKAREEFFPKRYMMELENIYNASIKKANICAA